MKRIKLVLYISLAIALFLSHCPLIYKISPEWNESVELFRYGNLLNKLYSELLIVSILKSFAFSIGTVAIIYLLNESSLEQKYKAVSIWYFAVLDGLVFLLYNIWHENMNVIIKNLAASIYYFIIFSSLMGFIAFLSVNTSKQEIETVKTLDKQAKQLQKQGLSQRQIGVKLGISASKVNRILKVK